MKYRFVTIEGNIGAGKTTLATKLAEDLKTRLILEQFADNPFLAKFYEDPAKHAFPVELFFMAERFSQLRQINATPDIFAAATITDYLFIKSLLFAGITLSEEEYNLYQRLFGIIYQNLPNPEIILYLHTPVEKLMHNIRNRGREFEVFITEDYLLKIQQRYLDYFRKQQKSRILIIDTADIDFVGNINHYQAVKQLLNEEWERGMHIIDPSK